MGENKTASKRKAEKTGGIKQDPSPVGEGWEMGSGGWGRSMVGVDSWNIPTGKRENNAHEIICRRVVANIAHNCSTLVKGAFKRMEGVYDATFGPAEKDLDT